MEMHRFLRISLKLMVLKGKDEKQDFFFYLPTENENIARTKKYIYTYIYRRQIKKLSGSFYPPP